jgi:predicted transcriptional regulator
MPGPKRDERRAAEAVRLYAGGLTVREVAAEVGASDRTVRKWLAGQLRRAGAPQRPDVRDERILELRAAPHDPEREARGLPRATPMSYARIGRLVGMSPTGVRMRHYALTGRERPDRAPEMGGRP